MAKYDDFVRIASERADDIVCASKGFPDRASFLRELEFSLARTRRLALVADLDDTALQIATKEVIDFVNERILSTDLTEIIEKLNVVGGFRVTHLLPPGFQDRKAENSYGDIIIWHEIIQHLLPRAEGVEPRDVVFVSRDQKTDWVSRAPFVLNLRGETIKGAHDQEMDVSRAHPFLVHELTGSARGKRLYVTHPAFLASVVDFMYRRNGQATQVACWLAGSHRPDLLSKLAANKLAAAAQDAVTPKRAPTISTAVGTVASSPPTDALNSISLKDLETTTRAEVAAYLKALPIEQESMLEGWISSACDGTLSPVRLGRLFAELIISGVAGFDHKVPTLFERLLEVTDAYKVNLAAVAMMVSAYFDRYSELLQTPVAVLSAVTISLESQDQLKPAFDALARLLKAADAELPYVPGTGRPKVAFVLDVAEGVTGGRRPIRDIRVGQQSALSQPLREDSPRSLSRLLGRPRETGCTGQDVRLLIAREFQIPPDRLSPDYDNKKITWSPDAGLVVLSMASPGGVSAGADEEND